MRASELINLLEQMIEKYGDCYMTRAVEDSMYGMEKVEEVEIIPHHETKYLCIK